MIHASATFKPHRSGCSTTCCNAFRSEWLTAQALNRNGLLVSKNIVDVCRCQPRRAVRLTSRLIATLMSPQRFARLRETCGLCWPSGAMHFTT